MHTLSFLLRLTYLQNSFGFFLIRDGNDSRKLVFASLVAVLNSLSIAFNFALPSEEDFFFLKIIKYSLSPISKSP